MRNNLKDKIIILIHSTISIIGILYIATLIFKLIINLIKK